MLNCVLNLVMNLDSSISVVEKKDFLGARELAASEVEARKLRPWPLGLK